MRVFNLWFLIICFVHRAMTLICSRPTTLASVTTKEGERVVDDMKRRGKFIAVETKTALMKGYSHSGDIAKADALFHAMCVSKCKFGLRMWLFIG